MADPEELLVERAKEALDAAVPFGLPHERWRGRHPEKRDLGLEVATEIDTPVVVPDREPVGDCGREAAKVVADALAQRFEGFEPLAVRRGMNPDALGRAVINRREDRGGAVDERHRRGRVGAPHHVRPVGHDAPRRAGVRRRTPAGGLAPGARPPA